MKPWRDTRSDRQYFERNRSKRNQSQTNAALARPEEPVFAPDAPWMFAPDASWNERIRVLDEAKRRCDDLERSRWRGTDEEQRKAMEEWQAAWNHYRNVFAAMYPADQQAAFAALVSGQPTNLNPILDFLEADPFFFRSGYVREEILTHLKRVPLTPGEAERLRVVLLNVVDKRDRREFRNFCRVAHLMATPELRDALQERLLSWDKNVQRRARWMLQSIEQK